jgi:Cu2+-containing amine oxidase
MSWDTINFEYCYQGPYSSASALATAFRRNELVECQMLNSNFEWTLVDSVSPLRTDGSIKEPASYHSDGKRYSIDSAQSRRVLNEPQEDEMISKDDVDKYHLSSYFRNVKAPPRRTNSKEDTKNNNMNRNLQVVGGDGTGHKVSWMGWSFHVSSDQMHGMAIHNLSFKGERLAYELSFQEYFASYSSVGSAAQVFYIDSNWEIGGSYSNLVPGIDCPEDATLLPIMQHNGDSAVTSTNLMCIYEKPYGEPLWRHGFGGYVAGLPRTALVVRVISTMGNYDYLAAVHLFADGILETKLEMGGYLQGGYATDVGVRDAEVPYFGTQVRDNMAGLLHDHIIGVKADLDVGGLSNTLRAGKVEYGTYEEATGTSAPHISYNGVKYMNWTTIDTERGISAKDYNTIMITSPQKNRWGAKKSYEIVFHTTIPSQVFPPDHPVGRTTAWQYHNIAVTRQKDSERRCSFPSNFLVGASVPSFDLRSFSAGNENVIEEDLVFWLMVSVTFNCRFILSLASHNKY